MKVLITGSRGFVGSQLKSYLVDRGDKVHDIDDEYLSHQNWKLQLLEVLNTVSPSAIFHVGACSDTLEQRVNYMMVRNYETTKVLSTWCRDKKVPFIYSSSAANYGTNGDYPSNLYGWSKYVAEDYVIANKGVALRYFNVYGPGEKHKGKMASIVLQAYMRYKGDKEPMGLFQGSPRRDFVYIEDVVSANIYALENYEKLSGQFYEVGSGEARLFEDMMNIMDIPYFYRDEVDTPQGYQYFTCSKKERQMTDWEPLHTLESGLSRYKKHLETMGDIE